MQGNSDDAQNDTVLTYSDFPKGGGNKLAQTTTLAIKGMTCASCVARVEKALTRIPEVASASVNLVTNEARVTAKDGQMLDTASLIAAVERIGYGASLPIIPAQNHETGKDTHEHDHMAHDGADGTLPPLKDWLNVQHWSHIAKNPEFRAWLAMFLAAPSLVAMLAEQGGNLFGQSFMVMEYLPIWLQASLASFILFVLGSEMIKSAWRALIHRTSNMDSLVTLGGVAAWGYSIALILTHDAHDAHDTHDTTAPPLYFEGVGLLVAFVLLGRALEHRARSRAGDAISALRQLQPLTARVRQNGAEIECPAASLVTHDILLVRAGERIAADGIIVEGMAAIDESLLTGESLPITRQIGDKVVAGSLNQDGFLAVRITAIGEDRMIASIIRQVASAQGSKPIWQKQVDQIAAWFVPAIMAVSAISFLGWWLWAGDTVIATRAAIGVLVIACPCALGLATPVSMMVGVGLAARRGILIRDADSLEQCRKIDVVLFDKTGTLTTGKPRVTDYFPVTGTGRDRDIAVIAALQQGASHPLADAARRFASDIGGGNIIAEEINAIAGAGVKGKIEGRLYGFGHQRLWSVDSPNLIDISAPDYDGLNDWRKNALSRGETVSYFVELSPSPRILGGMSFADTPRPTAKTAIAELHKMGVKTMILSGDSAEATANLAQSLGVDKAIGNLTPDDKLQHLLRLREGGQAIAMIGDGINDAPALAAANLGIAMGSGTDVAMKAAALVLMRSDPILVPQALHLARRIYGKIRQGLIWAFAYNLFGIPLAALGYLSPQLAAAAMAFSSIAVVVNALSLRWARQAAD